MFKPFCDPFTSANSRLPLLLCSLFYMRGWGSLKNNTIAICPVIVSYYPSNEFHGGSEPHSGASETPLFSLPLLRSFCSSPCSLYHQWYIACEIQDLPTPAFNVILLSSKETQKPRLGPFAIKIRFRQLLGHRHLGGKVTLRNLYVQNPS